MPQTPALDPLVAAASNESAANIPDGALPEVATPFELPDNAPGVKNFPGSRRAAQLGGEIKRLASLIAAATHQLLTTIRTFDEERLWAAHGCTNCAHWLVWKLGIDPRTAREYVRVAHALGGLPHLDGAFAAGEVTYSKVRAVTRVANESSDQVLADVARLTNGAQLETVCRLTRKVVEEQAKKGEDLDEASSVRRAEAMAAAAIDRTVRMKRIGYGKTLVSFEVWEDERSVIESTLRIGLAALRQESKREQEEATGLEAAETLTSCGSDGPRDRARAAGFWGDDEEEGVEGGSAEPLVYAADHEAPTEPIGLEAAETLTFRGSDGPRDSARTAGFWCDVEECGVDGGSAEPLPIAADHDAPTEVIGLEAAETLTSCGSDGPRGHSIESEFVAEASSLTSANGSAEPPRIGDGPHPGAPEPIPSAPATPTLGSVDALLFALDAFAKQTLDGGEIRTRNAGERNALLLMVRPGCEAGSNAMLPVPVDTSDPDTLIRSGALTDHPSGGAHRTDGTWLPRETVERVCCDAGITPMLESKTGEVLDVGRSRRTVPSAIRRALEVRDRGCRFPGCTNHGWTDAHHIVHWAGPERGETKLSNLVLLCHAHHVAVHEGQFSVSLDAAGMPRFFAPDGTPLRSTSDPLTLPLGDTDGLDAACRLGCELDATPWDANRVRGRSPYGEDAAVAGYPAAPISPQAVSRFRTGIEPEYGEIVGGICARHFGPRRGRERSAIPRRGRLVKEGEE